MSFVCDYRIGGTCLSAEVVLIGDDDHVRSGFPLWLGCPLMIVPASLARAQGQPCASDVPPDRRAAQRNLALAAPHWRSACDLLSAGGWVELEGPARGVSECVELLEKGTRVREMHAQVQATGGAAGSAAMTTLPQDTVMRMVMFSSPEEAARRALLLFLLTWDPFYGMTTVSKSGYS